MVTKKNNTREKEEKKGGIKVGKLQLNKEMVRDLTADDLKKVKGGLVVTTIIGIIIPLLVPDSPKIPPVKK